MDISQLEHTRRNAESLAALLWLLQAAADNKGGEELEAYASGFYKLAEMAQETADSLSQFQEQAELAAA